MVIEVVLVFEQEPAPFVLMREPIRLIDGLCSLPTKKKAAGYHVKAMNSSEDRGVKVIREDVKKYCTLDVNDEHDLPSKYPSPRLKFVLLLSSWKESRNLLKA